MKSMMLLKKEASPQGPNNQTILNLKSLVSDSCLVWCCLKICDKFESIHLKFKANLCLIAHLALYNLALVLLLLTLTLS